jgi:hypothetical protein
MYEESFSVLQSILLFSNFCNMGYYFKLFSVVSTYLGVLSYLELGLGPYIVKNRSKFGLVYVLDADFNQENDFLIYQGFFADSSVSYYKANLILPTIAYTEKAATYINLEGRYRFSKRAVIPFKSLYADYEIIESLSCLKLIKISFNFSKIRYFYVVCFFFIELINYECIFLRNLNYFIDLLSLRTGVCKKFFSNFDANLLIIQPVKLFFGVIFFCKITVSLFNRTLNNYYGSDAYCRNSKALSLSASKIVAYYNFREN